MSKTAERVTFYEERGDPGSIRHFRLVDIKYSNGDLFYSGWIQDFADARTGPTLFGSNYQEFDLDLETVHKRDEYWNPIKFEPGDVTLREATPADLDEIIDLNFQNYFEGGYIQISAYQGLNHVIDGDHTTLCAELGGRIYGFLYIDWKIRAAEGAAYFDNLFCAPAVRENGLGQRLTEAGIALAREKGMKSIAGQVTGNADHCRHIMRLLAQHGFAVEAQAQPFPGWYQRVGSGTQPLPADFGLGLGGVSGGGWWVSGLVDGAASNPAVLVQMAT